MTGAATRRSWAIFDRLPAHRIAINEADCMIRQRREPAQRSVRSRAGERQACYRTPVVPVPDNFFSARLSRRFDLRSRDRELPFQHGAGVEWALAALPTVAALLGLAKRRIRVGWRSDSKRQRQQCRAVGGRRRVDGSAFLSSLQVGGSQCRRRHCCHGCRGVWHALTRRPDVVAFTRADGETRQLHRG
jgi:hypothetical protein